jgi:FtsH-binding integral membrane protein
MQDFTRPPQYGPAPQTAALAAGSEAVFFQRIYVWMCGALAVTALTGYVLSTSKAWTRALLSTPSMWIGIVAVQLGLVLLISFLFGRLSSLAVKALYLAYAVSIGLTVSLVILFYDPAVVCKAFVSTAGVYGAMALYGLVTRRSLQGWGTFLFMGLAGVIIASVVNFFTHSAALDFVVCCAGVIVFAGLTAYDHQKLRVIHAGGFGDSETESKAVCMGALQLYLDFINIFFFLLRLLGRGGE